MKTTKAILLLALGIAAARGAQTNIITITNIVPRDQFLRQIDNVKYNARTDRGWESYRGEVVQILPREGAIIRTYTLKHDRKRTQLLRELSTDPRVVATRVPGAEILVRNLPGQLTAGRDIEFHALHIGTTNVAGRTLHVWDHGRYADFQEVVSSRKIVTP